MNEQIYATPSQLSVFDANMRYAWKQYYFKYYPHYANVQYNLKYNDVLDILMDANNLWFGDNFNRRPDDAIEWLMSHDILRFTADRKTRTYRIRLLGCEPIIAKVEYMFASHKSAVWGIIADHFHLPKPVKVKATPTSGYPDIWELSMNLQTLSA